MKIIIAAALFIVSAGLCHAGTLKNSKEMRAFGEQVMAHVAAGNLDRAFAEMKAVAVVSATEIDSAAVQSKAQREQYGQRYGAAIGYEFISEKSVGESLYRVQFIEKTEKSALPWSFYFYKSPEGWQLNTFFWNDQPQQLFVHD